MHGLKDASIDGWIDGWMDGWIDRWMHLQKKTPMKSKK